MWTCCRANPLGKEQAQPLSSTRIERKERTDQVFLVNMELRTDQVFLVNMELEYQEEVQSEYQE